MSDSANIRSGNARRRARLGQRGVGLIELMIAMSVLTIGLLGSMIMIVIGMESNTRNRTDTTATVLDQEILETFATLKNYPLTGNVTMYDCALSAGAANQHTASYLQGTAAAGGAGAPLTATGDIDWTQPTPVLATSATAGYAMMYRTCSGDTYEVRWNVMDANPGVPVNLSRLSILTVSSRQKSANGNRVAMLFAQPTTLRTMIENSSY